ncbi:MAG TPA: DUF6152 family protein [Gammaproteobacteria bacterium]|nr:DUF6152 family protein [Gammaproteobacteria bacterium]
MKLHTSLAAGAALLASALLAPGAFAHHSFAAEFDRNLPIDVTGTVSKVEWMNPHARFYVDATDASGNDVTWNFELTSPNVLMRQGWTRTSLKVGDKISVKGFRAKRADNVANASSVVLANGRRLFTGSASAANAESEPEGGAGAGAAPSSGASSGSAASGASSGGN